MADQDPKLRPGLRPKLSVNIGRRRVITAMGTLAAASWLPHSIRAQNTMPEAEILVIGGGIAGACGPDSPYLGRSRPHASFAWRGKGN